MMKHVKPIGLALMILVAFSFVVSCGEEPKRRIQTEHGVTHQKLAFLYQSFDEIYRQHRGDDPYQVLMSDTFLDFVALGLDEPLESLDDIRDGWGNSIVFEINENYAPGRDANLLTIYSGGANGKLGDEDDLRFPWAE